MRALMIAATTATLVACATKPVSPGAAQPVPDEQRLAYTTATTAANARLVITRDAGLIGSGCGLMVMIDGSDAAVVRKSETVTLHVEPGERIVGVAMTGGGLCGIQKDRSRRETAVQVPDHGERKLRISITAGGELVLAPTTL